jgi:hypothetical protein
LGKAFYRSKWEREVPIAIAQGGHFALMNAPYWARMWTQQEFHLPENEPACVCGEQVFKALYLLNQQI